MAAVPKDDEAAVGRVIGGLGVGDTRQRSSAASLPAIPRTCLGIDDLAGVTSDTPASNKDKRA